MHLRWRCFAAAILTLVSVCVPARAQHTFFRTSMTEAQVSSEFTGAIIDLCPNQQGTRSVGTGYLIDQARGYVITAAHVLRAQGCGGGCQKPVIGTSPALPGQRLHFKPVLCLDAADMALLEATPQDALRSVRPLDISLTPASSGLTFYTAGYPLGFTQVQIQKADPTGDYGHELSLDGRIVNSGLKQLKASSYAGDSGSPVIDNTGAVVGTGLETIENNILLYRPLSQATRLLDRIPPDSRVLQLDKLVRETKNPALVRRQLTEEMIPNSYNPSNLELYEWEELFSRSPKLYQTSATYFLDPILNAYIDRGLNDPRTLELMVKLSSKASSVASALVDFAKQKMSAGDAAAASFASLQAFRLYGESHSSLGQVQALLVTVKAVAQQDNFSGAWFYLQKADKLTTKLPADARGGISPNIHTLALTIKGKCASCSF